MAGQGAKKLKAANITTVTYLSLGFFVSLVVHLLLFFFLDADIWVYLLVGLFVLNTALLYILHSSASSETIFDLSKDGFYPYYCDVIMISSATLVLSCLSAYFFLLLLSIPIFSLYKAFTLFSTLQSALPPSPSPSSSPAPTEKKKVKIIRR